VLPFIFKITSKITTQAEHKIFVLPVYQFFLFMPSNFANALSSNIGLWYQQVVAGCVRATAENALAQVRDSQC
jgi:hypothetical protein